jgi:poly-gamma-glutamate capsule biosynthesis protein CapA/YwtB (metallophosphatase superfamily)
MTRHQGMLKKGLRPGLWLAALGLPAILLAYGGRAASRDGGAASLSRATDRPAAGSGPAGQVRLAFVGDVMLDCLPGEAVARGEDPFADFAPLFRQADLVVGNLECVIATRGEAVDKPWTFRAHPRCVPLLAWHFHALALANNHTGDFGKDAFVEQLDRLRGVVGTFGGGRDLREARAPLLLERHGVRIALLGYNEFKPHAFAAGPDTPGVAWSVDEHVLDDIRAARAVHGADVVIPFMHWGWEHEPEPCDRQRDLARRMIDAGADLVIGGHPHVTQGAEYYRGRLIVYSLGNFVFDGFREPEARQGWVLRLTVSKQGLVNWDTVVARMDDQGIPHPDRGTPGPFGVAGLDPIGLRVAE